MKQILRIGTRDSKLALWQAQEVKSRLESQGVKCELVAVKSPGDIDLTTPLHQFGTTGIFTKILDDALYANQIDIAVHSLKDYPTQSPEGLTIPAVLERGPHQDILVHSGDTSFLNNGNEATVATGSIRRIAQWKGKFSNHTTTNLRGNVHTRLRKLEENGWHGAIFAKAGLYRVNILPENHIVLDWMIPAPAQGVIAIGCRQKDQNVVELLSKINHQETLLTSTIEREFLRTVEGGCSAPVGALALVNGDNITLKAGVFELDGSKQVVVEKTVSLQNAQGLGKATAIEVLEKGGKEIMEKIKHA